VPPGAQCETVCIGHGDGNIVLAAAATFCCCFEQAEIRTRGVREAQEQQQRGEIKQASRFSFPFLTSTLNFLYVLKANSGV